LRKLFIPQLICHDECSESFLDLSCGEQQSGPCYLQRPVMKIDRPADLRINAWDGKEAPVLDFPANVGASIEIAKAYLSPPYLPKSWDWRAKNVGWGLILRDDANRTIEEKAVGADAPDPIRRLLAARAPAPILRYQPNKPSGQLIRYYADGKQEILSTAAARRGIGEGAIPQYLLIYGSPTEIPWAVQYSLNLSAFVGRLDLTVEEGLGNYVEALISGWSHLPRGDAGKPLVWSADWGRPDVTFLLSKLIAKALADRFANDDETSQYSWLTGADATCGALGDALRAQSPGFICTTSHGMTGPLSDPSATIATLGSPVDSGRQALPLDQMNGWHSGGAIWYSHACCSAGSDRQSRYANLIGPEQRGGALLRRIAEVAGARIAPLPRKLLGAENPLGAFVGRVEPTFDWTLRDPITKQGTTDALIGCLYDRLFTIEHPAPIGWALAEAFAEAGNFLGLVPAPGETDDRATLDAYRQLAAIDRQNLVIIGDPTVTLHFAGERAHRADIPMGGR